MKIAATRSEDREEIEVTKLKENLEEEQATVGTDRKARDCLSLNKKQ